MGIQPHLAHSFTYQWPLCIRTESSGCDRLYALQTQKYLLYGSFLKNINFFFFYCLFVYLAALGVSCSMWDLSLQFTDSQLWHAGSAVVVHGLSCSMAYGILVL